MAPSKSSFAQITAATSGTPPTRKRSVRRGVNKAQAGEESQSASPKSCATYCHLLPSSNKYVLEETRPCSPPLASSDISFSDKQEARKENKYSESSQPYLQKATVREMKKTPSLSRRQRRTIISNESDRNPPICECNSLMPTKLSVSQGFLERTALAAENALLRPFLPIPCQCEDRKASRLTEDLLLQTSSTCDASAAVSALKSSMQAECHSDGSVSTKTYCCSIATPNCCETIRPWNDPLCVTSGLFFVAGLISLYVGQTVCGILQCCASIASTAFHRSHETMYLPIDATFSTTLLAIAVWTTVKAFTLSSAGLEGGSAGLIRDQDNSLARWVGAAPLVGYFLIADGAACGFLMVYCGMPGGPRYEFWHKIWHYTSATGTLIASLFLAAHFPEFDAILMEEFLELFLSNLEWALAGWVGSAISILI